MDIEIVWMEDPSYFTVLEQRDASWKEGGVSRDSMHEQLARPATPLESLSPAFLPAGICCHIYIYIGK